MVASSKHDRLDQDNTHENNRTRCKLENDHQRAWNMFEYHTIKSDENIHTGLPKISDILQKCEKNEMTIGHLRG
jgi:hypothetical protein